MPGYLVLRDRRLRGGVPPRPRLYIVNTDAAAPLASAFREINGFARMAGKINAMFVLCHGYAGEIPRQQVCADAGGMGLQLGRDDVVHGNVALWTAIRGRVNNIVIYACAAGDTEPGSEGTTADGAYLMGALAIHAGATVFAADRIQWYSTYDGLANGRYDFGAWEGQLWRFPPDGAPPSKVTGAPVELHRAR